MLQYLTKCDKEETFKMSNKKGSSYLVLKNDINYSISDDDKPGEQQMGACYGDLEVLIK